MLKTKWERKTRLRTLKSGFVFEGAVGGRAVAEWVGEGTKEVVETVIPEALLSAAHRTASDAEAQMKKNAPWTDRTGNARRDLFAVAGQDGTMFYIDLGHGPTIHYGIWLENRWNGRFAIVLPTAEIVMARLPELLQGEIRMEIGGKGSKYRHSGTGRFA